MEFRKIRLWMAIAIMVGGIAAFFLWNTDPVLYHEQDEGGAEGGGAGIHKSEIDEFNGIKDVRFKLKEKVGRLNHIPELERLKVADVDMPLIFEGQVSEELKQAILHDVELVFGHYSGHIFYAMTWPKEIEYGGGTVEIGKGISFTGKGSYRPKEFQNNFGIILSQKGEGEVVVLRELVDAYRQAWKQKQEYSEVYAQLERYVEFLDGVAKQAVGVEKLPGKLSTMYYLKGSPRWFSEELDKKDPDEFLEAIGDVFGYRMPSILEVEKQMRNAAIESTEKGPVFVTEIYLFVAEDELKRGVPVIYSDGEWKMFIPD